VLTHYGRKLLRVRRSIFYPDGCSVEHPVLQCVQIRTMDPKSGDANPVQRFRVVLSDVRNFIQTMVATGSNDIVTSGKLRKGCIVKLLKFNAQQVKDKKWVRALLCSPMH
jgi:replication factor A1